MEWEEEEGSVWFILLTLNERTSGCPPDPDPDPDDAVPLVPTAAPPPPPPADFEEEPWAGGPDREGSDSGDPFLAPPERATLNDLPPTSPAS